MKLSEKDFFYTIVHIVLHGNVEVSVCFFRQLVEAWVWVWRSDSYDIGGIYKLLKKKEGERFHPTRREMLS